MSPENAFFYERRNLVRDNHEVNIDHLKYHCFWCIGAQRRQMTYMEFDLGLHMPERHKMDMVKLPIGRGKLDDRIDYAVEQCKGMTICVREHPERREELFSSSPP
jgi:hypothetical protein